MWLHVLAADLSQTNCSNFLMPFSAQVYSGTSACICSWLYLQFCISVHVCRLSDLCSAQPQDGLENTRRNWSVFWFSLACFLSIICLYGDKDCCCWPQSSDWALLCGRCTRRNDVQALFSIAGLMELLPREAKRRGIETTLIAGTLREHVLK